MPGLLALDPLIWLSSSRFLAPHSWLWIPGFGFLFTVPCAEFTDLHSLHRRPGLGVPASDSWLATPGPGFLGVHMCVFSCALFVTYGRCADWFCPGRVSYVAPWAVFIGSSQHGHRNFTGSKLLVSLVGAPWC